MFQKIRTKHKQNKLRHFGPAIQRSMLGAGVEYKNKQFVTHTTLSYQTSAVKTLTPRQTAILGALLAILAWGVIENWHFTLTCLTCILIVLYFADLIFSLSLIVRSFLNMPEVIITAKELGNLHPAQLPRFSILCPLYKEARILPQFINAMQSLKYPKDKLEVLLLFEADDTETVTTAKKLKLPPYMKIVIVPHSLPKTKPKALNYGLVYARGEYIVIYDAEDVPDPDQLQKAVAAFGKVDDSVFCLQAKLNFYNPQQNILTRLFTAEYSTWFDLILTGLYSLGGPIPLGGTSNFFRRKDIMRIEGWDAFNVCEDCDLGMRLFKNGYRTALFNSTTFEEANSQLSNWIRQRSHWIKGYIQGFFVHLRSPERFGISPKNPHILTFLLVVGGKTLSVFINPLLWIITLSYFVFRPWIGTFIESFYPTPMFYLALFTLIIGNFIYVTNYMLGCARRGYWHLVEFAYVVPVYWLMMSFSAWKAVYQLLVKPHYWEKTTHGLHLSRGT